MNGFTSFLDRLHHNDPLTETESPVRNAVVVSVLSFIFIYSMDNRVVSLLGVWWEEFLVYALVPVVLAFFILYRSAWHREIKRVLRTPLAACLSCLIVGSTIVAAGIALLLAVMVYYCFVDHFSAFHY